MPFVVINPNQTDAKSPVDDLLMDTIREDLDYLLSAIASSNAQPFDFRLDGPLSLLQYSPFSTLRRVHPNNTLANISNPLSIAERIDGALIARTQTLTASKIFLKKGGESGSLVCDLRKFRTVNTPIYSIRPKFEDAMSGPAVRRFSGVATQSVNRATPAINTQSITQWKASLNVQSIYGITAGDLQRYRQINVDVAPDSDYAIGDEIVLSGTTAEDGLYTIVEVNRGGTPNIVIAGDLTGGSGTDQTTPAGTLDLQAWSFNYSNPVDPAFTPGERVAMDGHTDPENNFNGASNLHPPIYAINQGGNNIIIKNFGVYDGVAQATANGTASCLRWTYTYLSAAPANGLEVGKMANFSGHTSGLNNGNKLVKAIDVAGFNVTVFSSSGATQAAVAGSLNSCFYTFPTVADLSLVANVGDYFLYSNFGILSIPETPNPAFQITEMNILSGLNIVAYGHTDGIDGTADGIRSTHVLLEFDSDQSAIYSTASRVNIKETLDLFGLPFPSTRTCDGVFDVGAINVGGGANYNIAIETKDVYTVVGYLQNSPGGRIVAESRSVYSVKPRIDFPTISTITEPQEMIIEVTGTYGSEAVLSENDLVCLCVEQIPSDVSFAPAEGLVLQVG